MSQMHWAGGIDPLALLGAARREAELRVLERHLVAAVATGALPARAVAEWDQWRAAGAPGWRGWPDLHEG